MSFCHVPTGFLSTRRPSLFAGKSTLVAWESGLPFPLGAGRLNAGPLRKGGEMSHTQLKAHFTLQRWQRLSCLHLAREHGLPVPGFVLDRAGCDRSLESSMQLELEGSHFGKASLRCARAAWYSWRQRASVQNRGCSCGFVGYSRNLNALLSTWLSFKGLLDQFQRCASCCRTIRSCSSTGSGAVS
jgi:hypothetical protein